MLVAFAGFHGFAHFNFQFSIDEVAALIAKYNILSLIPVCLIFENINAKM
jgi:hypothetical protein